MCTDLILPGDGTQPNGFTKYPPISGRTMDFGAVLPWQLTIVPIQTALSAIPPTTGNNPAFTWTTKYGYVGIGIQQSPQVKNQITLPADTADTIVVDAMNIYGMSAAALWLPPSVYPAPCDAPAGAQLVSSLDICRWVVSNYLDVSTLQQDLICISKKEVTSLGHVIAFWDPEQTPTGSKTPLHFQFHDRSGKSLVLELCKGELIITDNSKLGVMTNAPFLDWHVTNLENYCLVNNVDMASDATQTFVELKVPPAGHGGGLKALSASALPADRFLRTVFNINNSLPFLNQLNSVNLPNPAISHVMNLLKNVYVVRGQCAAPPGSGELPDYTQWEIVRDHYNNVLFISTPDSLGYWTVDYSQFKSHLLSPGPVYTSLLTNATGRTPIPQ